MVNKFYITTPIFYVNAAPHMGHAYTSILADVIARYHRDSMAQVFFLTGTAEHGEKILKSAEAEGLGPQAFVDKNVKKFLSLDRELNISNDSFIRNSDKKNHWPGAQKLWTEIFSNNDIYKKDYKGLYCVGCEKFITEKELVDGKCPDHDKEPKEVEEENYFFRLSKYQNQVRKLIEKGEIEIVPASRKKELLSFIDEGLEDISFSRPEKSVPWGIPVPNDDTHMMYVWCEELSNYISALGYGQKNDTNFKKFWPADLHVIGKDILRFHAIIWPAMLLSARLPLPKKILAHGMIISDGKKMSKTLGNVLDPKEYIKKYGAESFRYYLTRKVSPFEDGDFTLDKFIETYNADLANGLGNLVSRVLKMSEQYFQGKVAQHKPENVLLRNKIETVDGIKELEGYDVPYIIENNILPEYHHKMNSLHIHQAMDAVWSLIKNLDGYITDYEPFKLIKEDKEKTEDVIWNLLYGIYYVAQLIKPVMPDTSEEIIFLLGAELDDKKVPISFKTKSLKEPLFMRIEE